MARLLILIAVLPIIITIVMRWWFGIRVLKSNESKTCRCDLDNWKQTFGEKNLPASDNAGITTFAEHFRNAALADWKKEDRKTAMSREGTRRFGVAVPPLSAMVVIIGVIVGRITPFYAIAIFLLATAFSAVISYLSIAIEINALLNASRKLRNSGIFHRRDDEDAVIQAAVALSWKEAAPPIYNLIQN